MLLNELIAAFKADYRGRDASIFGRLEFWSESVGQIEVNDLTADLLDQHLIALAQRGKRVRIGNGWGFPAVSKPMANGTHNRYRASLASVFKWGKEKRHLPRAWHSPLKDIPAEKEGQGRLEFYTAEQVERLVVFARTSVWPKLPALILLAFVTGLRRGAITGLRWKDIDLEAGTASVDRMKNGDSHIAILTPKVIEELRRIRSPHADPMDLVFCGKKSPNRAHDFRGAYEKAITDAGLPRLVFHGIRHSTASHLAKANVSLVQIASVMHHKNFATTKRYAHLAVGDRAAVVSQHFA